MLGLGVGMQIGGNVAPAGGSAPSGPPFANVVLLSGFNAALDGVTALTDESGFARTITYTSDTNESPVLTGTDTSVVMFGTSSLYLHSGAAYFSCADSADFNFAAGTFTIEGWWNFDSVGARYLIRQKETGDLGWSLRLTATNIILDGSSDGTTVTTLATGAWVPNINQFYHIAADFDGTTYRVYVDGALVASGTTVITIHDSAQLMKIGGLNGATNGFIGHLDELRVTKGYACYASATGFTRPTAAFPRS